MHESRPASVLFRHADAGRASFGGDEELRALLQRRLRAICWIILAATFGQALIVLGFSDVVARRVPAAAGSPLRNLVVGALFLVVALALAPSRPRGLRALRGIEGVVFALGAWLNISLNWFDYGTLQGVYERAPIDVALGQTSYWVATMVMYATLIPNTARRTARVLAVLAVIPLLVHVAAFGAGLMPASIAPLVVVSSALMLLITGVTLTFGSYRYELVARREAAARELGQYVLGEQIGSGGMGDVFRGEHRMLRRPVAIKLISPEQAGSPEAIARFEREAQAVALLTHPNTVQVFDYGRAEDGTFYSVMEYLPGETLDAIVRRDGPLLVPRAVHVLRQLCGALAEAHAQGLVHRDIKPGNVMLGERGGVTDVAKLLDFGLVITRRPGSDEAKLTSAGMMVGTPEFMSPEQCGDEEGAIGPQSDLYSLGALGYFLVTGRSPFAGRGAVQMLAAHVYETPAAPSSIVPAVPPSLDAILLRCLAKRPEERFADAAELEHALRTVVSTV
jgi:serine/threonine-protein kinase